MKLTAAAVRDLFDYDEDRGHLIWRVALSSRGLVGVVAGTKRRDGRVQIRIESKNYFAHRIIWLLKTGAWPKHQIDHRNLDKGDNRWSNLREATCAQNQCNQTVKVNNKLRVKGVRRHWSGRLEAYITVNRKQIFLGGFSDIDKAKAAYADAASKYHGEFARAE